MNQTEPMKPSESAVKPSKFRNHIQAIYDGLKHDKTFMQASKETHSVQLHAVIIQENLVLLLEPEVKWDVILQNMMLLRSSLEEEGYVSQSPASETE